ncbi:acyltransferase [Pseudoteredinibacter isoporae]|uniref:acyltransferase n=1 Tax=Pseudoteredinibacter isoporae TaxID=570281 RepID=UPI0031057CAE
MSKNKEIDYIPQHKLRLSFMPWLYFRLKSKHLTWAKPWQDELQHRLMSLETVNIAEPCFIAPEAKLFAEPGRLIDIGANSFVAADCVLHGPISIGCQVSINHHCSLDGGRHGIAIGDNCRLAPYCTLYAFNHGMSLDRAIHQQAVTSKGITLGHDVWLGARVGIVDGVRIGNHAVVGMGSLISKDVPDYAIVAGNPAKLIGDRRQLSEDALQQLADDIGL